MILLFSVTQLTGAQDSENVYASSSDLNTQSVETVEKGTSLQSVLSKIEDRYNVNFFYKSELMGSKTFSEQQVLYFGNDLHSMLSRLLSEFGFTYKVLTHRTLGIIPKQSEPKQEINLEQVTGTVTDAGTGEPLPGVNVVVKGTTTGTSTDSDGNYELNLPSLQDTLVFSFVGYQTQEVPVNGRTEIDVALQVQAVSGEELVVVGYGSVQKSDLTGSISSLPADQLNTGSQASVDQAIQGRIPGVQVTQTSAEPGGGFSIRIRGTNSITAGNEPLYVIDGLPGANPSNSLNPADIQSIEVLKDASATAIYGARGSNGVILITTKQGQGGSSLAVNYNGSVGFQQTAKKLDLMNAQEYMSFYNSLSEARGDDPPFTQEEMNAIGSGTDWLDEVLRGAPLQEHQLSFSGGSEDTQYYLSLNYLDQDGVVINTNFQRYSGRINLKHSLDENLRFGLNLNNSLEQDVTVPLGTGVNAGAGVIATAIQLPPTMPVRNEDGSFAQSSQDLSNAVAQAKTIDNDGEIKRIFGNAFAEYDITDNLSARVNLGFNQRTSERDIFLNTITQRGQLNEGQATKNQNENTNYLFEFTAEYNQVFREDHTLNLLGGYSFQRFTNSGFRASAQNFPTTAFGSNNLNAGEKVKNEVGSFKAENTLLSGFGRINYNYDDRYLLTSTVRLDGSSRFGKNNKYAVFPSGALAWRISNEPFFPDDGFFSAFTDLKLRGSYGISGNQEIGNARSLVLLGIGPIAVFGGEEFTSIAPTQLANPDLRWETTSQLDIGLDFGLLDDRITGTVDYFESNTNDLLLELPIPTTSGFASSLQNVGDTKNTGFEFSINTSNIVGEFNWSTNLNFATLKNEVTNLGELPRILQGGRRFITEFTILRKGDPVNAYFGYVVEGVFQSQQEIDNFPSHPTAEPGSRRFKDINEDGIIDEEDRTILGDPFPDFTLGFNNNFGYKGFELDLFLEGRFGFELANFTKIDSENPIDNLRNREDYVLNRWTPENPTNENPSFVNPPRTFDFNSRIVEDASFLRLKNVRLSYTFPNLNLGGISSLAVYATGQNLITITDYDGFNPDVNVLGSSNVRIDYNAYPLARIYTLGINLRI